MVPGTVVWCTPLPEQAWSGRTAAVEGGGAGNTAVVVPQGAAKYYVLK